MFRNSRLIIGISICCLVLIAMMFPIDSFAQCPMCKMSAESNLKSGGTMGKGLNAGILYMLATPYLIVGTIGYFWWKHNRKIGK